MAKYNKIMPRTSHFRNYSLSYSTFRLTSLLAELVLIRLISAHLLRAFYCCAFRTRAHTRLTLKIPRIPHIYFKKYCFILKNELNILMLHRFFNKFINFQLLYK